MKISTRTFSDRGNESLLTLREGLHALERLLPAHLLFGGTFLFNLHDLLERFHSPLRGRLSTGRPRLARTWRGGVLTCRSRGRSHPLRPRRRRGVLRAGPGGGSRSGGLCRAAGWVSRCPPRGRGGRFGS